MKALPVIIKAKLYGSIKNLSQKPHATADL